MSPTKKTPLAPLPRVVQIRAHQINDAILWVKNVAMHKVEWRLFLAVNLYFAWAEGIFQNAVRYRDVGVVELLVPGAVFLAGYREFAGGRVIQIGDDDNHRP